MHHIPTVFPHIFSRELKPLSFPVYFCVSAFSIARNRVGFRAHFAVISTLMATVILGTGPSVLSFFFFLFFFLFSFNAFVFFGSVRAVFMQALCLKYPHGTLSRRVGVGV